MDDLDASRQYATVVLDGGPRRRRPRPRGARGGGAVLRRVMDEATAALAAEMVGTCQAIFDIVHTYVGEREQFGVKIGSFQAIKHKLANMFVALESARATTYFAALTIAEDDDRRPLAMATAKASVGRLPEADRPGGHPVPRRHRLHVGARHAHVREAGEGDGGHVRLGGASTGPGWRR